MNNTGKSCAMSTTGRRALRITGMVIGGVIFAVVVAFLFGYIVQYIWNWLMPELFGLKTIGYWQAFALVILARMLFGGLGHHGRRDSGHFHDKWTGWSKERTGIPDADQEHFKRYWEEEGKQAFDDYLRRSGKPTS